MERRPAADGTAGAGAGDGVVILDDMGMTAGVDMM